MLLLDAEEIQVVRLERGWRPAPDRISICACEASTPAPDGVDHLLGDLVLDCKEVALQALVARSLDVRAGRCVD